jgi:hypothetical protein
MTVFILQQSLFAFPGSPETDNMDVKPLKTYPGTGGTLILRLPLLRVNVIFKKTKQSIFFSIGLISPQSIDIIFFKPRSRSFSLPASMSIIRLREISENF